MSKSTTEMAPVLHRKSTTMKGIHPKPASWKNRDGNKHYEAFRMYTTKLDRPQILNGRERPALWDICSGVVLWLPRKDAITPWTLRKFPRLLNLKPRYFNHPVMVLDVNVTGPEDAVVIFALMDSLKGLVGRGANTSQERLYMKIFHKGTHHAEYVLSFDDGGVDGATSIFNAGFRQLHEQETESDHSYEGKYGLERRTQMRKISFIWTKRKARTDA
jgi:hypothetical protein